MKNCILGQNPWFYTQISDKKVIYGHLFRGKNEFLSKYHILWPNARFYTEVSDKKKWFLSKNSKLWTVFAKKNWFLSKNPFWVKNPLFYPEFLERKKWFFCCNIEFMSTFRDPKTEFLYQKSNFGRKSTFLSRILDRKLWFFEFMPTFRDEKLEFCSKIHFLAQNPLFLENFRG